MRTACTKLDDKTFDALASKCSKDGFDSVYECLRTLIMRYVGDTGTVYVRLELLEKRVARLESVVAKIISLIRDRY